LAGRNVQCVDNMSLPLRQGRFPAFWVTVQRPQNGSEWKNPNPKDRLMLANIDVAMVAMHGKRAVNIGIDMGSGLWVATAVEYDTGKKRCHRFTGEGYDQDCYRMVGEYTQRGYDVHVLYEAGRNGFTPARTLSCDCGAEVTVVPVNKLELVTCGKRVKTDRIDSQLLASLDPRCMKVPRVWVPSVEEECRRCALREKKRIERDIARCNNRILSILERWPGRKGRVHLPAATWTERIGELRATGLVPKLELLRIEAMVREEATLEANLGEWNGQLVRLEEKEREEAHAEGAQSTVDVLRQYRGVGDEIARAIAWYIGDLHRFPNGRKFASYLGLTPTPFSSSSKTREQGISKQGNPELRRLAIQLAWLWRQWQPGSALARKWEPRLKPGRRKGERTRSRKTAVVALARQLMVSLWRLAARGEPIEGAVVNCPLPALP